MHCRFAKGILSYIPPIQSHVLRHGQTATRRFEHKLVDWTRNANIITPSLRHIEVSNIS